MGKLANKVAVITGGSNGIGLATAKLFVAEGARVFITGRRQVELDNAVSEIGANITAIQGDVANLDDLDRLYQQIKVEAGKIDIVVANAGMVELQTLATASPEHFDKTFNVNTRGLFFSVQKALPLLQDGGSVVVVSSVVHTLGVPFYTVYSGSKAAVRSFARSWAAELKDRNIRVNCLSPGATETPMFAGQFKSKEESDGAKVIFASKTPLGRLGKPEELAKAALFLASDDSSYITGIDLSVDGGMTQV